MQLLILINKINYRSENDEKQIPNRKQHTQIHRLHKKKKN